jgi:hypothetical protein
MGTSLQLIHDTDTNLNDYTGLMGEVTVSTNDGRPRSSAGIAGGKKLAFLEDFDPQDWQVPPLNLGWIGLGGAWRNPRYRIDSSGLVTIEGAMQHATASTDGVIFTLLAGYRPTADLIFCGYSAGGLCRWNVKSNGNVEVAASNMFFTSMSGIQFYID